MHIINKCWDLYMHECQLETEKNIFIQRYFQINYSTLFNSIFTFYFPKSLES